MGDNAILIVEDDFANICGTAALLENASVTVDVAGSVEDAKECLRKRPYRLILVDWTLPAKQGGPSHTEAGGKLLIELKEGKLGLTNKGIPYFVITKQTDQFDNQKQPFEGCLGILS